MTCNRANKSPFAIPPLRSKDRGQPPINMQQHSSKPYRVARLNCKYTPKRLIAFRADDLKVKRRSFNFIQREHQNDLKIGE